MVGMKFGGTSVGSVESIANLRDIVLSEAETPVVVVSAMNGLTDMLRDALAAAGCRHSNLEEGHTAVVEIRKRHQVVLEALAPSEAENVLKEIDDLLSKFTRVCELVRLRGEVTPRDTALVLSIGERMSARQIAAVLQASGATAIAIDATELIVTDDCSTEAVPRMDETKNNIVERLMPLIESGTICVITGFIGASTDGSTTLLGRGGSDYSGAIITAALGLPEYVVWTDVPGVLSADPRVVPEAHTISVLTYAEMGDLSYYGAKVLHPKTLQPVMKAGIPVRVKSTFEPQKSGTLIMKEGGTDHPIKAVTAVKEVAMIIVEGSGMCGVVGIAARTFGAVANAGTSVLLITQSSSEHSICFVVPSDQSHKVVASIRAELSPEIDRGDVDDVRANTDVAIVSVVGAGIRTTPGVASQVFGAIAAHGINVTAIAYGSSNTSLSFTVMESEHTQAILAMHDLTRDTPAK